MFNWNDLIYFLALARQKRLMPAAKQLKVDYTTVSRRIAELERSLDVKLFDRSMDGFNLTEAGVKLVGMAEVIEKSAASIPETLGKQGGTFAAGRVRIVSMEGIAAFYLSAKVKEFARERPQITIELVTERSLVNLAKREADVLISFVPPSGPKLSVRRSGGFRLALYASHGYLHERGEPQSRTDLLHHDFVDYVEDLVAIEPVHWLREVLTPSNVVFRSSSMAAQQTAVAAGLGIGLLPLFSAKTNEHLVPVLPEEVVVRRDLYIAHHEDTDFLRRVRLTTHFLGDLFERDNQYLNQF